MPLTPETLPRHELNDLRVRVVDAESDDYVGIAGQVVRETTNTLSIRGSGDDRVRQVPKSGTTFEFDLTDEAATAREGVGTDDDPDRERAGDSAAHVTVDGDRLLSRPARRSETTGESVWQ